MANHKFKLTNIIPNAWFYKLKHMNKTSNNTTNSMLKKSHLPPPAPPSSPPQPEPQCQTRKSYHITRELAFDHRKNPPRKSKSSSKTRKSTTTTTRRSSSTSSCSCQSTSTFTSLSSRSKCRSPPSPPLPLKEPDDVVKTVYNVGFLVEDALLKIKAANNAVADDNKQSIVDRNALASNKPEHFIDNNTKFLLPPIITKQKTQESRSSNNMGGNSSRRLSVSSPGGVRLKVNSPKIMGIKQGQNGNKNGGRKKKSNIRESFAVVKSSFDPQRDFKESMVEMIVQNNLRSTKDLEDLLACYLSLNSVEYHHVIINVFKQIWFDFRQPK